MLAILLPVAAVVVVAGTALGTGILKLPGGKSSSPSVEPPPAVDNVAIAAQGSLTLGASASVKTISLGKEGASATIAAPGKPWDGLQMDFPAGSWSGSKVKVTAQPITVSSYGDLVTPASPLYTVSGAEGMAPEPVIVKIPVSIPEDSFAMGFYYDASGHLEGMPLLAEDSTSMTVATQHFSRFFASLVKRSLLPATIDSGFRPGLDDWEFTNWGSSIAGGHCMGQVVTEAWYYLERHVKAGASRLHGLYDNNGGVKTPDLWQDDSNAYRLGGVAQHQMNATWITTSAGAFLRKLGGRGLDALQYDAFRYAIAVTGEPQLVLLWDAQGGNAHAILAYRVAPSAVFVADPNYPAGLKFIPFDAKAGKFGTYESGLNWKEIEKGNATAYTRFIYAAKTALVDWSTLSADWAAFDAGTIGDDVFPDFVLETLSGRDADGNDVWVPLVDGYRTADKTLPIRLSDPHHAGVIAMDLYHGNSATPFAVGFNQLPVTLEPGANSLGIYVSGAKPGLSDGYVDFVRLNVVLDAAPSAAATATVTPGNFNRAVVYMPLSGANVRKTNLDVKIKMTGPTTFTLQGPQPGIVSLTGTLSDGNKSVTLTIVHANDTENPICADHTILTNLPVLKSSGPASRSVSFGVSGWADVMAVLDDSLPWTGIDNVHGGGTIARCTTNKQWSHDEANTGAQVIVTLYY